MFGRLYWSIVVVVAGACVGSFLNVLIYRLPRGLAVHRPGRSFCPECGHPISWYDNIPVISYLLLGGRCRHCRSAISLQYPLVELCTALVFLMLFDGFFVAQLREGVGGLSADWPLLIAHLVLMGGLIALAVMDLEAYMVDVRITWLIGAVGILGHALWTPASSFKVELVRLGGAVLPGFGGWLRPGPTGAVVACAGVAGLAIGGLLFLRRREEMPSEEPVPPPPGEMPVPAQSIEEPPAAGMRPRRVGGWYRPAIVLLVGLVVAYVWQVARDGQPVPLSGLETPSSAVADAGPGDGGLWTHPAVVRLACGLVLCFAGLALVASCPQPQADSEILEAIDAEAVDSRRNALWELKLLAPAILLVVGAGAVLAWAGPSGWRYVEAWLHWSPTGSWRPMWGLATGLSGWILGGAVGWLARIVFTLAFGKEALGMGDVHILAAAGAVAGWPVALAGFFLAAPLALLGLVVIALRRQSRALPYGPWLALGFVVVCLFQDVLLGYLRVRWILE
ncbi:MAG TPA: prepilin peptidase [Phycisphaerae bacterium]|nr:prepilin peptidase [Phycisphaerae bacterium]